MLGAVILAYVFVKATIEYSAQDGGYAKAVLGVGSPVVITHHHGPARDRCC